MRRLDRDREIEFLNSALTRHHPSPASLYMSFEKDPAALQRRKLAAQVLDVDLDAAPNFPAWSELWRWLSQQWSLGPNNPQRRILVLDEITYAFESDPALLSSLQQAWDGLFRESGLSTVLCSSHIHAMEALMTAESPLFGRITVDGTYSRSALRC